MAVSESRLAVFAGCIGRLSCRATSVSLRMASKASWSFVLLALVIACSANDDVGNYYEYDADFPKLSEEPSVVLLVKRQAPETKEKSKQALLEKENRTQSENISQNSSNVKSNDSAVQVADAADKSTTTVAPTTILPDSFFNQTIPDFEEKNFTFSNSTEDHHRYYTSSTLTDPKDGMKFWVDLNAQDVDKVKVHEMLSQSHRRAATIMLSFDFPFYGHLVRNITIATGGFLYTGDYVHSWLAATQYIAPLMANFDTSMSNLSSIKYMDNGTAFTVQWEQVSLQDRVEAGNFTFQATLFSNGDIVFAYKDVPLPVTEIKDEAHPVKVGVSDAYIIDRTIFFVRRKTIYEYHKVELKKETVANGTAIYFTALPTCLTLKTCESCIGNTIDFECVWCPTADRCSDGMDRHRQDWLVKGCDKSFYGNISNCSAPATTVAPLTELPTAPPPKPTSRPIEPVTNRPVDVQSSTAAQNVFTTTSTPASTTVKSDDQSNTNNVVVDARTANGGESAEHQGSNVSSVIGILFLIALVFGGGGWVLYAYRNPHTPSGQCFIRYRPSQWRWRSGEAHYTAAAIHM